MLAASGELTKALAGIVVALVAAVGGYLAARAPAKITAEEKASADLFGAYQTYAAEARSLMQAERVEFARQLAELRAAHSAERAEWAGERSRLEARIDELEAKVTALLDHP